MIKCSKRQPRRCSVKIQTFRRVLHPIITDRCGGTDIMSTFYSHSTCIPDYGNRYYDDMLPIAQQSWIALRRCDGFKSYVSLHVFLISCQNLFECKQKPGILEVLRNQLEINKKGKAIRVTGREGPYGCEPSRLPHFPDNRLTDGGEVVSLTRRKPFTLQEDSPYSFLLEAESTPGP
jgi:hypothetical protein